MKTGIYEVTLNHVIPMHRGYYCFIVRRFVHVCVCVCGSEVGILGVGVVIMHDVRIRLAFGISAC